MSYTETYNNSAFLTTIWDGAKFIAQIESDVNITTTLEGISRGATETHFQFASTISAGEKTALDAIVSTFDCSLECAKEMKIKAIDRRTVQLIDQGFEYPASSGNMHSLSQESQTNLLGARLTKDDPAFTYPVTFNWLDDSGTTSIANATELDAFYLTALGTKRAAIDSGTTLKDQVRAATTVAAVNAIVDNR